jgi:hypothetical protein
MIFREDYIGSNEAPVQEFPWCARSWNANALRAESPNLDRTIDLWTSTHAFLERVRRPG